MSRADIIRHILLSAIWGSSFIFMRVLSPQLGPVLTADLRVLIGGFALLLYFAVIRLDLEWKRFWKIYLVIGIINSGIPFLLYAIAALHLPASYLAILNATAPMWGMLFAALWLSERPLLINVVGLIVGITGVALITNLGPVEVTPTVLMALSLCLGATACYGLAGVLMKRIAGETKPLAMASASQVCAGLVLLPAAAFSEPTITVGTSVLVGSILALALLCSGVAYILYFRLIANNGPTRALTVTFNIPLFGMLWGFLFLHEQISLTMIFGAALVIAGTRLVLRKRVPQAAAIPRPVAEEKSA